MAAFLRKMLGIGKMPDDMRAEVDREGIIYFAEFIPVTYRFTGTIPRRKSAKGEVRSYVGALAITSQRVLATLSTVPKKAGRTVDHRWDAPQQGALQAELSTEGLRLQIDISKVDPSFTGELSLHYKTAIGEDVFTMLPSTRMAFDVPREFVLRALGIPF